MLFIALCGAFATCGSCAVCTTVVASEAGKAAKRMQVRDATPDAGAAVQP
jgi:hypothetical protein